ncbi:MAG: hypothetical protein BWY32_00530 [bacterium ADurb.Bin243]|nr:MAG: hypothetical protein BWY32_00530 [bacterium ADurb.Bin243]
MKKIKKIYIAILLLSALLAFIYGQPPLNRINGEKAGHVAENISKSTSSPKPPAPDYSFTLRAAGVSSMPVYSLYDVKIFGDTIKTEKRFECVLGFGAREIINLKNIQKTLLISDNEREIYIFDEKERKISGRVISFPAGGGLNGAEKDSITAIAKSPDEKLIAAALKNKKTVELLTADNFQTVLSVEHDAGNIIFLYFDAKNNLYMVSGGRDGKRTGLYMAAGGLSYSKIEKISDFSLAADSFAVDASAPRPVFIFYNRSSGTVFSIDSASAQSGVIVSATPQREALQGRPVQIIADKGEIKLIRSDIKKISIVKGGKLTSEIDCPELDGAEIAAGGGNLKYFLAASGGSCKFGLLEKSENKLIRGGILEGLSSLGCADICE